jgi:hypothetical protein
MNMKGGPHAEPFTNTITLTLSPVVKDARNTVDRTAPPWQPHLETPLFTQRRRVI